MATYISPTGNPEVWESKPDNYYTPEEWAKAHPQPEPEPLSQEQKEANVRMIRNQYLLDTDKYVTIPDFPISESTKSQYIAYRQYLRDYPTTENWYESNPKTFDEYIGD